MARLRSDQALLPAALAAVFPTPQIGQFLLDSDILSSGAGAALVSGRASFHRMHVGPGTYDAVAYGVTTAQAGGSTSYTVGVYPDDNSGTWPDTTAVPLAQTGSVDLTSTGASKASAFASPLVLTRSANLLWMVGFYLVTTAPTTAALLTAVSNNVQALGRSNAVSVTNVVRGYASTGLSALPTTARTTANLAPSSSQDITVLGLRRSA